RQSVSPAFSWKLTSITAGAGPDGSSNTVLSRSTTRRLEVGDWRLGEVTENAEAGCRPLFSELLSRAWVIAPRPSCLSRPPPCVSSQPPFPNLQPPRRAASHVDLPVLAEDGAHRIGDFADRRIRLHGADDRRDEVVAPAGRGGDGVERRAPVGGVP